MFNAVLRMLRIALVATIIATLVAQDPTFSIFINSLIALRATLNATFYLIQTLVNRITSEHLPIFSRLRIYFADLIQRLLAAMAPTLEPILA